MANKNVNKKKRKKRLTKRQLEDKQHEELMRKRLAEIAASLKTETDEDKISRLREEQAFLKERFKGFKIIQKRRSSPSIRTYRG